ncbi:MAG: hypothetical protein ACYDCI_00320 [Candidatus Limnocylindrales bacterium]
MRDGAGSDVIGEEELTMATKRAEQPSLFGDEPPVAVRAYGQRRPRTDPVTPVVAAIKAHQEAAGERLPWEPPATAAPALPPLGRSVPVTPSGQVAMAVEWTKRTDEDTYESGDVLLVATHMPDGAPGSNWCYELVVVDCDEHYFALRTAEGERWDGDVYDIIYYARVTSPERS